MQRIRLNRRIALLFASFFLVSCLLLWFVVLPSLFPAQFGIAPRDETWERIQRQGVLRIGMDASFPPFETVDDKNNFAGYDVELGQMLAEQFGGRAEFVNVGFDGLIDALKAEKFDVIISGFPFDPLLTQDVAYSYNYFNAGQVLVVRGDETRIRGVDDLGGKRVAVELGSGGDIEGRKLAKRLKLTLATYDDPQAVLDALRNGQADAAIVDAVTAYSAAKSPSAVRVIGEPITDEPYVIVVRLKSFKLLERINGAILQMRQDGTLERLRAKWLQE